MIPRQLAACERAVGLVGGEIVECFWDIESARKPLSARGHGAVAGRERVGVPREGGLPELLAATLRGRAFCGVIVESIDRVSRITADATRIEQELEQRDIGLFAADEPMCASATALLTRRVKQGVAEWYVRDLLERSHRGMQESARQGWHTGGRTPYGYALHEHQHPNPAKAREGKRKHRLILDPLRAPIARMIFEDYALHGLRLGEIAAKLNGDLERFPEPAANPRDQATLDRMAAVKMWGLSQLHAMLRNPKYTGYNVWGRHDKRPGRPSLRPAAQWVWSPTPTHPAIITKDLFEQVQQRSRQNYVAAKQPPAGHPGRRARRPGRIYLLRGRIHCEPGWISRRRGL
jgi:site-specific DNA recombinase